MKFYGLHWVTDDNTPMQVRIETRTLQLWGRSCPAGGEWTPWRMMGVCRTEDGTLAETCVNAIHAAVAETANKLNRACTIRLSGDVTGSGVLDGSGDVQISTALSDHGQNDRVAALEQRVAVLEAEGSRQEDLRELRQKVQDLEYEINSLRNFVVPGD